MPGIIDSLVVELGLDPSKFSSKLKQSLADISKFKEGADKGSKDVESSAKRMVEQFAGVERALLRLSTLFLGGVGIAAFVSRVVKGTAELGRLSTILNTSARDLWAWQQAGAKVGATADDITGSWVRMHNTIQDFMVQPGGMGNANIAWLAQRGVRFTGPGGQVRSQTDIYTDINRAMQGVPRPRAESVLRNAGLGPGTIQMLLQPTRQFLEEFKRFQALGPTAEQAKKAQEELAQFNKALSEFEAVGRKIAIEVLPPLTSAFGGLMKQLSSFAEWVDRMTGGWLTRYGEQVLGKNEMRPQGWSGGHTNLWSPPKLGGWGGLLPGTPGQSFPQPPRRPGGSGANFLGSDTAQKLGIRSGVGDNLVTVQTAAGPIKVNKAAAADLSGAVNALVKAGAPVGTIGSYSRRRIAGSNRWSQHALGGAMDLFDQSGRGIISPAGAAWIKSHPKEWEGIKQRYNLVGGEEFGDVGHVEWGGPGFGKEHYGTTTEMSQRSRWNSVRGSTFNDAQTASGMSPNIPGIALPDRNMLGKKVRVRTPDGREFETVVTDYGPAKWTGRGIDINAPLARKMGYGTRNFPTDQKFQWQQIHDDIGGGAKDSWGNNARAIPWLNPGSLSLIKGMQTNNTSTSTSTAETHIGSLTVQTEPRANPWGIANQIKESIERVGSTAEVEGGPN